MAKNKVEYEIKAYDKASKSFKSVGQEADRTKNKVDGLNSKTSSGAGQSASAWSKVGGAMKGALGIAAAFTAIRFAWKIGKDAVMATAQIEKYNVTLKTMLGSTIAARDRMQEYLDVAKKTPFELSQVVEAGNQLQAIGRYSRQNLEMLGDLAAASGKPMEQVMGAYAKLATGQKGEGVNMFRDLLISTDDWTKATGKAKAKNGELLASTEEMMAALPKIMKDKGFFGMMANQAETTDGKLSNLKDGIFTLSDALGERLKPETDDTISAFTKWVGITEDWIRIPVAEKIAEEQSEVNSLVNSIVNANVASEERKTLLEELVRKYPDFLGKLDKETVKTEELKDRLVEVNKEYDKKMKKTIMMGVLEDATQDYQDALKNKLRLQRLDDYQKQLGQAMVDEKNAKEGSTEKKVATAKIGALKRKVSETATIGEYGDTGAGRASRRKKYDMELKAQQSILNETKKAIDKEMKDLIGDENEEGVTSSSKTKPTTAEGGSEYVSPSAVLSGNGGAGGSGGGSKTISTHITNLISGDINIHTTTLKEGAGEIKRIVIQALIDATNEIN